MQSPVALIVFNRPDVTARVAGVIAKARPPKVFVVADGPRSNRPEDVQKCVATRAIIDRIDWPCEVIRKYADVNLGCGMGPATGLDWVFEHTDRAIILEDDCLAHPSFFRYCDELLEKYCDDERIMQIAGSNFQCGHRRGAYSYFFSRFKICWGWATWRRAWRHMDMGVKLWSEFREGAWLRDLVGDIRAVQHWTEKFDHAYRAGGKVDYWDYQWLFSTWAQNGLCIMPNANLVSNVGFDAEATHTTSTESRWARLPLQEISFPLEHPPIVIRDKEADDFFVKEVVLTDLAQPESLWRRMAQKLRNVYAAAIPEPARMLVRNLRSSS
ncbi:MAG TPA: glycosyltransferase family 2 protein [Verrucomicrobiae bacterium]|nr:glycosyltransferase family 2 protein [Verrucomicrobiae bacterium]